MESGIATLTGQVRLVRDDNELRGCRAEVNLNTGISKLFPCQDGQGQDGQEEDGQDQDGQDQDDQDHDG